MGTIKKYLSLFPLIVYTLICPINFTKHYQAYTVFSNPTADQFIIKSGNQRPVILEPYTIYNMHREKLEPLKIIQASATEQKDRLRESGTQPTLHVVQDATGTISYHVQDNLLFDRLQADFNHALETTPEYYQDALTGVKKNYPGNISTDWYAAALPAPITPAEFIQKIKNNFQRYFKPDYTLSHKPDAQPHIPKRIHQIWIGTKPMPAVYKKYQAAWRALHPDWDYKLWSNRDLVHYSWSSPVIKQAFKQAKNITAKADILRFDILYQQGGVYIDIDTEPLESLDGLVHSFDFFAILYGPHKGTLVIDTFFIGAKPQHALMLRTLKNIAKFSRQPPDLSAITSQKQFVHNLSMGVMPLTYAVCDLLNKLDTQDIILPMGYFSHHKKTPWSYGIHYPLRLWSSQTTAGYQK